MLLFDLSGPQSAEGGNRGARTAGTPAPDLWDAYWTLRPPGDRGSGYWRMVAKLQGTRFDDHQFERLVAAESRVMDVLRSAQTGTAREARTAHSLLPLAPFAGPG
ncbi:hypothetical protein ACPZ19_50930 [Amycolatopsis lurida]